MTTKKNEKNEKTVETPTIAVGRPALIRSGQSGVWVGTLAEPVMGPEAGRFAVRLRDARRIHYWTGAAACSGLAVAGPGKGSRVCPPVADVLLADCCEVLAVTEAAMGAVVALPAWNP